MLEPTVEWVAAEFFLHAPGNQLVELKLTVQVALESCSRQCYVETLRGIAFRFWKCRYALLAQLCCWCVVGRKELNERLASVEAVQIVDALQVVHGHRLARETY